MNTCPRCHDSALVPTCNGVLCLLCGYEEGDELSPYAELIAAAPGAPIEMKMPKRDYWEKKAHDLRLGEEAATRHGVSLEDLQKPLRGWRNTPPKLHIAFHAVIDDLASAKLSTTRIARVLCRRNRTILDSPGLVRGRRRHDGQQ